jgi:hypothetical protein
MKAKERVKVILDAYFNEQTDFCRFTSQDVCDNLRDIAELTPDQVTDYLLDRGWQLVRKDDRLVWSD